MIDEQYYTDLAVQAPAIKSIKQLRRLNFSLPAFNRCSWVSDKLRETWGPRIQDIQFVRAKVFTHAIQAGLFSCAFLKLRADEMRKLNDWLKHIDKMGIRCLSDRISSPLGDFPVVLGLSKSLGHFERAWCKGNLHIMSDLCARANCCEAFQRNLQEEWKLRDPILAQALNTPNAVMKNGIVKLKEPGYLNTIPHLLRILPLSHFPCSTHCRPSSELAAANLKLFREHGLLEQAANLETILSWPMEWSALHGIAETKLPILKITSDTDAMAQSYRVQIHSDNYPDNCVTGVAFPFPVPRFSTISDSQGFKNGLANTKHVAIPTVQKHPSPNIFCKPEKENKVARRLTLQPRSSHILDQTLLCLQDYVSFSELVIEDIYLSNYFNIIQLNNGAIGACMNSYYFKSEQAKEQARKYFLSLTQYDPLLLNYLNNEQQAGLLQINLKSCLVNAISRPLLQREVGVGSDHVRFIQKFDPQFFPKSAQSAVVIGFGGYMDYLIYMTEIRNIHVSDLWMNHRGKTIARRQKYYQNKMPEKNISFSDGSDNLEKIANTELLCITGSALSNGTMDTLLAAADCETVIVQGQSASIWPQILFDKGVSLLSTSIKPDNLIMLARSSPKHYRSLLEGALPMLHLQNNCRNTGIPH